MKRKIIIALILFLAVTAALLYYIHKVILPSQIKKIILEKSQEFLGRPISLSDVEFTVAKGFILKDVTVLEKDRSAKLFLHADQVSFNVLFLPLMKEKKVIIPSLNIQNPSLHVSRESANTWNFSDIVEKIKSAPPEKLPFAVYVTNLNVTKGEVAFHDKTIDPPFSEKLNVSRLRANISLPRHIRFSFEGNIPMAEAQATLEAKGLFDFVSKELSAEATVDNLDAVRYVKNYSSLKSIDLTQAVLNKVHISLKVKEQAIDATSRMDFQDLKLSSRVSPAEFSGHPLVNLQVQYNPAQERKWDYR